MYTWFKQISKLSSVTGLSDSVNEDQVIELFAGLSIKAIHISHEPEPDGCPTGSVSLPKPPEHISHGCSYKHIAANV